MSVRLHRAAAAAPAADRVSAAWRSAAELAAHGQCRPLAVGARQRGEGAGEPSIIWPCPGLNVHRLAAAALSLAVGASPSQSPAMSPRSGKLDITLASKAFAALRTAHAASKAMKEACHIQKGREDAGAGGDAAGGRAPPRPSPLRPRQARDRPQQAASEADSESGASTESPCGEARALEVPPADCRTPPPLLAHRSLSPARSAQTLPEEHEADCTVQTGSRPCCEAAGAHVQIGMPALRIGGCLPALQRHGSSSHTPHSAACDRNSRQMRDSIAEMKEAAHLEDAALATWCDGLRTPSALRSSSRPRSGLQRRQQPPDWNTDIGAPLSLDGPLPPLPSRRPRTGCRSASRPSRQPRQCGKAEATIAPARAKQEALRLPSAERRRRPLERCASQTSPEVERAAGLAKAEELEQDEARGGAGLPARCSGAEPPLPSCSTFVELGASVPLTARPQRDS